MADKTVPEELDPTSSSFDAKKAFESPNFLAGLVNDEETQKYKNIYELREEVHKQEFNVVRDLEGVTGPGGLPSKRTPVIPVGRLFTADQAPLPGKPKKRRRNVLTMMAEVKGPMAVLRTCQETNTKVKVYTRNHSEVRSMLTGFVVAFDRHWNLILKDCEEIFQRKIKHKSPFFGDTSNAAQVADLTICEETRTFGNQSYWIQEHKTPQTWSNPFQAAGTSQQSSMASQRIDGKQGIEPSLSRDAETLRLGITPPETAMGEPTQKRKRKRKKNEIRHRFVKQLLVRGECVVLVQVYGEPSPDQQTVES